VFKKPVICACPVPSLLLNSLPAEPLGSTLLIPQPLDMIQFTGILCLRNL